MSLSKRIILYAFGVLLGLVIVIFFFDKKKTEFSYLPNARVLKNFTYKKTSIGDNIPLNEKDFGEFLKNANVDFDKSKPREEPCGIYFVKNDTIELKIKNCRDSVFVVSYTKLKLQ